MGNAELKQPELDRLFIAARHSAALSAPSEALMERVMRDALAAMPAAPGMAAPGMAAQESATRELIGSELAGSESARQRAPRQDLRGQGAAVPMLAGPGMRPGMTGLRSAMLQRAAMPRIAAGLSRFWSALSAGFGGGGVVASLGAVAVIAVFLGYTAPAGLAGDLLTRLDSGESYDESDGGIEIEPVAIYFLAGG